MSTEEELNQSHDEDDHGDTGKSKDSQKNEDDPDDSSGESTPTESTATENLSTMTNVSEEGGDGEGEKDDEGPSDIEYQIYTTSGQSIEEQMKENE
ncbi:hypothetical protein K461DRAFT_106313 [Myriangium duriaei CBS 260.36]|uniref:Uncharacterized protein n=1 Tax=Myriangium duriaei CBS 260.36 TaxID=1168546 RepID=A0A9P4J409_9PEZI|nr:hypothetical protein K461DRAFT_106313 [Myriangium duriaei CBS 260.36]